MDLCFEDRDEFQRKPMAEKIISLLASDVDISPMLIDGDWGTGKTEFCHKTINLLKSTQPDKYATIYVDAFKADHADSPLMTILASVYSNIQGHGSEEKRKKLMEKALPVLRYGAKSLLKAGVGHFFRQDATDVLTGLEEEIKVATNTAIDATIEATLKNHADPEKDINALKEVLGNLVKDKPIIFFIDELDRCRPDFAVQMLEVIKHIFDVDGVQFVLITNTKQLTAAINHRYGAAVNAKRYLDKFLKFSCNLPHILTQEHYHSLNFVSVAYYSKLVSESHILKTLKLTGHGSPTYSWIKLLLMEHEISLREVEKYVRYLEIYQTVSTEKLTSKLPAYDIMYVIGIFIFSVKPDLAQKLFTNKVKADELVEYLCYYELVKDSNYTFYIDILKLFVLGCRYDGSLSSDFRNDINPQLDHIQRYFSHFARSMVDYDFVYSHVVETIKEISLCGRL